VGTAERRDGRVAYWGSLAFLMKGGIEMNKLTVIIIMILIILSLNCFATSDKKPFEPEGIMLSQSELEQLFSNKITFDAQLKDATVEVTCFPNGTMEVNYGGVKSSGTYRIINGKKCQKIEFGKEYCLIYYKMSENKYCVLNDDGSFHAYTTIK
jgi:hypothetical protein